MKKHSKAPEPCKVFETEEVDGYNKEQEKQLRVRKRPPNQTEVDRWLEMYRVLFPQDDPILIPSPCKHRQIIVDISNIQTVYHLDEKRAQLHLVKFKEYLKEELPKKMWTDLQPDLGIFAENQKAALETRIVDMVHDCTDNFFEVCQRSFLLPPSTPCSSEVLKEQPPLSSKVSLDEPILECPPLTQVELTSSFYTSSYLAPSDETFEPDRALEQDSLTGWQTDANSFRQPYNTATTTHASTQSYGISNGLYSPYQHHSMTPSHYLIQDRPVLSSFQPLMLEHDLAGIENPMNLDFNNILSSIGPMNPSQFGDDNNQSFG